MAINRRVVILYLSALLLCLSFPLIAHEQLVASRAHHKRSSKGNVSVRHSSTSKAASGDHVAYTQFSYESIQFQNDKVTTSGFGLLGAYEYRAALSPSVIVAGGGGLRYASLSYSSGESSSTLSPITSFIGGSLNFPVGNKMLIGFAFDYDLLTLGGTAESKYSGDDFDDPVTVSAKIEKFSRLELLARIQYQFERKMGLMFDVGKESGSLVLSAGSIKSAPVTFDGYTFRGGIWFKL